MDFHGLNNQNNSWFCLIEISTMKKYFVLEIYSKRTSYNTSRLLKKKNIYLKIPFYVLYVVLFDRMRHFYSTNFYANFYNPSHDKKFSSYERAVNFKLKFITVLKV